MNTSKKIAIVSNTSWSVYNFRLGLLQRLKSYGHEVVIIAPKDEFSSKLIAMGFSYELVHIDNYGTNPLNELKIIQQFTSIYKKHQFDFIFHYTIKPNIYGSIAAKRCGIPSIAITTGLGHLFSYKSLVVRKFTMAMYRLASHYSKQVWFLNKNDLDTFVGKKIVKPEKTVLLHSEGINVQWFKPSERKTNPNKLVFLFAGRLIWDKGIREFAEAAKVISEEYDNVEFQLLGFIAPNNPNAVPASQIQQWHKQKLLKYLGDTDDVRPFIEDCSCLIFPSFYGEGISRILLEASSMAKPIITTDSVGCRDIVEDGKNGFLVKPRDSEDLINKIKTFIAIDQNKRDQMGREGRAKVLREFDEEFVIKRYLETLSQFLNIPDPSEVKSQRTSKENR